MLTSGGVAGGVGSVGLSRPVSRSTELLHVSRQDSATGRRSWDSLIPDKKKGIESPGTSGPEGVNDERTRYSACVTSPPTTAFGGTSSPWFGAQSGQLLGCTMPRSILALSERPVTYEEELEERLGLMRVSAKTLYQRLAAEKKRGDDLSHQLDAREVTYRGVIEKMRSQYDQRFERLKNRARLLVTRCELLRGEKQQLEGRLAQSVQGAAMERLVMGRRVESLEDELERVRSEREQRDLPLLRVIEDADVEEEERKAEEERRKTEVKEELVVTEMVDEGGKRVEEQREEGGGGKTEDAVEARIEEDKDLEEMIRWRKRRISGSHYRTLCEIAITRVAWLEDQLRSTSKSFPATSSRLVVPLSPSYSLVRRSSSCPTLVPGPSNEEESQVPTGRPDKQINQDHTTILRQKTDSPREELSGLADSDRETITRVKSSTLATTRSPAKHRSLPPSIGHPKPPRTSSATIRHSFQKLLASGRPSSNEPSRVATRLDTPSDDEPTLDPFHADVRTKHGRKVKGHGGGPFEIPTFMAKRTASLPRVELFKKLQTAGRQDRDAPTFVSYADTNQPPLTKQERVLGVRLDHPSSPEKEVFSSSGSTPEVQDSPTTAAIQAAPLTKQERILGVRLDLSTSDKASTAPATTTASAHAVHASQTLPRKHERVLGVRLGSDTGPSTSSFVPDNPISDFSSHVHKESTESLPDKVLDGETADQTEVVSGMKRNRSVHSTFGRLHNRRNGVTDIARAEKKPTKQPPSPLEHLTKNLKQYLH